MALLNDIITVIQKIPLNQDGSLTLQPSAFTGNNFIEQWFANFLQSETFTLGGAKVQLNNEVLTVSGSSAIWNVANLNLSFAFSADANENVTIALSAIYSPAQAVTLIIMPWLEISNISLAGNFSQPATLADLNFSCTLQAPGFTGVPVTIKQASGTGWQMNIAAGTKQAVAATDVVALLGGSTLESFLPQLLVNILSGLQVNQLVVDFDIQAKTVSSFETGFTVTNGWDIAPVISLQPGLQINLTVLNAAAIANRTYKGNVVAAFLLAGVTIPVSLNQSDLNPSAWNFNLAQDISALLPDFSSLLQLAGQDLYNSIPSGLRDLASIAINTLNVNFDSVNEVLTEVSFTVQSNANWAVLPGYFEINSFQIALDITDVNVPATRNVTGTVNGQFALGDEFLVCSIVKNAANPNWTITAGLPAGKTLNILQLATSLFENKIAVPSNMAQVIFSTLNASITPSVGVFTLNAITTAPFTLFGNFAVSGFNLGITRAATTGNPISGTVTSQLVIGGVGITVFAALSNVAGAGWQFTGTTAQGQVLPVGNLLSYLGNIFGLTAPAWISNITLQNLLVNFNTSTSATLYEFQVTGNIPVAGTNMQIAVNFTMNGSSTAGFSKVLSGTITVNTSVFTLAFDSTTTDTHFSANWTAANPSGYLQLSEIFSALNIPLPGTDELDLSLKSVKLIYDFTKYSFVLEAQSASYGNAAFASYIDKNNVRQYYFGMAVSGAVNLSNLPLVSTLLPSGETLQINQMIAIISSVIISDAGAISSLNSLLGSTAPQVPSQGISGLVEFSMSVNLGSTQIPVSLGFGGSSQTTQAVTTQAVKKSETFTTSTSLETPSSTQPSGSVNWFSVQRNFGPLTVNRVGFKYVSNVVFVLLDASLVMGGMNVSVAGLSVGMNIKDFIPQFSIDGLGIEYSNGPVEIAGGFLKIDPPQSPATLEFAGGLIVKTESFSIAALGEYAQIPSGTSLFMFASVSASFGGPPYFFITGFCGGFGYNSSLTIPTLTQVDQFPFIAGLTDPSQASGTPLQVMQTISGHAGGTAWVTPAAGEMWAAIGIQFNTFSLINSTALLTAVFGSDFKLALIGLSTASFPMDSSTTYAYVELELEALFDPSDGIISFSAILSPNSYVLDPACHLTGGFAMYYWFGNNPHAGDFVVTLGGYSHYFTPPSWYPQVPRLGFNWALDSSISISGGSYFALTPSALMAGGSFNAVYQSGDLHAWFTAYADIIIWWNPFHFVADIGISIGASYKLNLLFTSVTVSVELGADLTLWGPPTGGTAHVYWSIISFTVNFGESQSTGIAVQQWSDFIPVLPAATDAVKFTAIKGISSPQAPQPSPQTNAPRMMAMRGTENSQSQNWLVRAGKFQFSTNAAVPVSDLYIGSASTTPVSSGNKLNISPMQQQGLSSSHKVYLQLANNGPEINMLDPQSPWTWMANTSNVPNALWGTGNNQTLSSGDDQLVMGQYTGMIFSAPDPSTGYTPGNATLQNLGFDPLTPGTNPLTKGQASVGPVPVQSTTTIAQIAQISTQQQNRNGIASALQTLGITVTNDNPVNLGNDAGILFADEPMLLNSSTTLTNHEMGLEQTLSTPAAPVVLLDYSISTSPSPVQISIANQPPNIASITVDVSFSGLGSVTCSNIIFYISEGNDSSDLTADDSFQCSSLPATQWNIVAQGQGTFLATPTKPEYGIISGTGLSFTFYNIKVNAQPGTTFISIQETTTSQTANTSLPVAKFLGEFFIDNFHADPSSISVGASTTLKWSATGSAILTLTWGNNSEDVSNVQTYTPTTPFLSETVFYLTATTQWNNQQVSTVLNFPLTVNTPVIGPVTVNTSAAINMGDSVTFTWTSQNADHCRLLPALGTGKLDANGNVSIVPTFHSYEFSIVAYDANELTNDASLPIQIQFNTGIINSFGANISTIYPGGAVVLSWNLTSAVALSIDQGVGNVSGSSVTVYPTQTTSYILSCQTSGGIITSQPVSITIIPLATYLVGRNYNATGQPLGLSFMSSSVAMTLYYSNQYIARQGPWTLSTGNVITVTEDDGTDVGQFQFNPAANTITIISFDGFNGIVLSSPVSASGPDLHIINFASHIHLMMSAPTPVQEPLLDYTVVTTPSPLQVSTVDGNQSAGTITINVSNTSGAVSGITTPVVCSSIMFYFNIGNDSTDLTPADGSVNGCAIKSSVAVGAWQIANLGQGTFVATPLTPADGIISTAALEFSFFGFNVNDAIGSTPITITEVTPSQTATTSLFVQKYLGSFYFSNFEAKINPVRFGASVDLTWNATVGFPLQLNWVAGGIPQSQDVSTVQSVTIPGLQANTAFYLVATIGANTQQLVFPVAVLIATFSQFIVDPLGPTINFGETVTITYTAANVDYCLLQPFMGTNTLPISGSVSFIPDAKNNSFYMEGIDATNQINTVRSATFPFQFNPGSINSFSVNPVSTYPDGPVTFSWGLISAIPVSIDQGIGNVSGNSAVAQVAQTTSFTLTYQTASGTFTSGPATLTIIPMTNYLNGKTYSCDMGYLKFTGTEEVIVSFPRMDINAVTASYSFSGAILSVMSFDSDNESQFQFDPAANTFACIQLNGVVFFDSFVLSLQSETLSKAAVIKTLSVPDPVLLLGYAVATSPSPLQVNAADASVTVVVSNNQIWPVTCSGIIFNFNIGAESADNLSSSDPKCSSQDASWQIVDQGGGQYLATPLTANAAKIVNQGLSFNFTDIQVNDTPGTTSVSIQEITSSQTAYGSLPVSKFLGDFSFGNFSATAETKIIEAGGSTVLTWDTSGSGAIVTLTWGENNSIDVTDVQTYTVTDLTQNTIFYLTAKSIVNGQNVSSVLSFTVTVLLPVVETFSLSSSLINLGDSIVLAWTTQNASYCRLIPPLGTGNLSANGSVTVIPPGNNPTNSISFYLQAFDTDGKVFGNSETLSVGFNPGTINSFTASFPGSTFTYPNAPVTLSWALINANSPSISGIGNVSGNTFTTTIGSTTSYALTCETGGNPITQNVLVTVNALEQFFTSRLYEVSNNVGAVEGIPGTIKSLWDGLVFLQNSQATYSWTYQELAWNGSQWEGTIASVNATYTGTWSVNGVTVILVTPQGTFNFLFDPPTNTLTIQNPPDYSGTDSAGQSYDLNSQRINRTFVND